MCIVSYKLYRGAYRISSMYIVSDSESFLRWSVWEKLHWGKGGGPENVGPMKKRYNVGECQVPAAATNG